MSIGRDLVKLNFMFNLLTKFKVHSKDELHQWDDLKQNQRARLEDLLEQHWNNRGDTFSQPPEGYSLAGEDASRSGEAILFAPHWAHNSTGLLGIKDETENLEDEGSRDGRISDGRKTVSSVDNVGVEVKNKLVADGDGLLLNRTKENEGTQSPLQQGDKSKFTNNHMIGLSVTQNPQTKISPTEAAGSKFSMTKEPNPEPREAVKRRDNETPEEVRILEEEKLEKEREELLLLHKMLDQEKELLRQQQLKKEEERQKGKKADSHLHGKQHHHLQTTQTPVN